MAREMDEVIELTKAQLKDYMYSAWCQGMFTNPEDIEQVIEEFNKFYEDGKWAD